MHSSRSSGSGSTLSRTVQQPPNCAAQISVSLVSATARAGRTALSLSLSLSSGRISTFYLFLHKLFNPFKHDHCEHLNLRHCQPVCSAERPTVCLMKRKWLREEKNSTTVFTFASEAETLSKRRKNSASQHLNNNNIMPTTSFQCSPSASPSPAASSSSSSAGDDKGNNEEEEEVEEEEEEVDISNGSNNSADNSAEEQQMQLQSEVPLRPYQRAILAKATKGNVVALLPTGTGKTLISIRLIRHLLHQTVGRFPADAKRTVFLAPTRVLVEQQFRYIRASIPEASVQFHHGDHNVDAWTREQWVGVFQQHQILLFTPDVLYSHILLRGFISITDLNLIVLDEVHRAMKKGNRVSRHAYRSLMDHYKVKTRELGVEQRPRILGLTATLLNPKEEVSQLGTVVEAFERIFQATIESDDTSQFIKEAKVYVVAYDDADYRGRLAREAAENRQNREEVLSKYGGEDPFAKVLEALQDSNEGGRNRRGGGAGGDASFLKELRNAITKVAHLLHPPTTTTTNGNNQQPVPYEPMGAWFAAEALSLFKSSLESKSTAMSALLVAVFDYLRGYVEAVYRTVPPLAPPPPQPTPPGSTTTSNELQWALSPARSDRLSALLKLLTVFRGSLNCIIFVKERTDANLLYRWLRCLAAHSADFSFLKPGFICGSPAKGFIRFDRCTARFKEGFESGQLNVMVATSVLEEGIDVPICNLVIRYDVPENFRAYTQSKGRARDADSFFIILAERGLESSQEFARTLTGFKLTEEFQRERCGKNDNEEDELARNWDEEDGELGSLDRGASFETKAGATLYERDAMAILHAYIQRLPSDYFTVKQPTFAYIERQVGGDGDGEGGEEEEEELEEGELPSSLCWPKQQQKQKSSSSVKYLAVFMLPINSSLTGGFVVGDYRGSKVRAKASCAFKACLLLHERGELDDHLNIVSSEFLLEKHIEELNLKVIDRTRANYRQAMAQMLKKAVYERETSQYSAAVRSRYTPSSQPNTRFYLYLIEFPKLANPVAFFGSFGAQQKSTEGGGGDSSVSQGQQQHQQQHLRMGLLVDRKLPSEKITSLVYLNRYQLQVRLAYRDSWTLNGRQLEAVRYFAGHLQQSVLLRAWPRAAKGGEPSAAPSEPSSPPPPETPPPQEQPRMTNFFAVPVLRRSQDLAVVNYELIEELRKWEATLGELHQELKKPSPQLPPFTTTSVEALRAAWPPKTLFSCFHRRVKGGAAPPPLHFVDEISSTTVLDTFQESIKKLPAGAEKDGKGGGQSSPKRMVIETTYLDFYHRRYGVRLQQPPELPLVHAVQVESTMRALCKFGLTYTVERMDRATKRARQEERQRAKKEEEEGQGEEKEKEAPKSHLNFPAELMRPYPLPFYFYVMLNAIPVVLYRLESYLLAVEYLQRLSAGTSGSDGHLHHFTITEDPRLPGSLLTAEYYNNQRTNEDGEEEEGEKGGEDDEDMEVEEEDASKSAATAAYRLMDIDAIDGSAEDVQTTSASEVALMEAVTAALPADFAAHQAASRQTMALQHLRKNDAYFDRILVKLKTALGEVVATTTSSSSPRGPSPSSSSAIGWRGVGGGGASLVEEGGNGSAPAPITTSEQLDFGDTSLYVYDGPVLDHQHHQHSQVFFNSFASGRLPNPWYIVKAFTLKKAADLFNLEQLETVGDAFLKMSTAMTLYFRYPNYDEGRLSQLKQALVGNENLFRLGVEAGLPRFAHARPLAIGDSWVVPFLVPGAGQALLPGDRYNRPLELKYKQVADLVEALIGACLVYGSAGSALAFFRSIGLPVFDPTAYADSPVVDPVRYHQAELDRNFERIGERFTDPADLELFERFRVDLGPMVEEAYRAGGKFQQVEETLGYSFKHKYFLVQAFTHSSYTEVDTGISSSTSSSSAAFNHISSFQRLEFIGDAVLDYLITFFVYQKNQRLLPSEITDLRASLVNNVFYSSIVIKYNLHRALRCSSGALLQSVAQYVKKYKCAKFEQLGALINDARFSEVLSGLEREQEQEEAEGAEKQEGAGEWMGAFDPRQTDDEVPKSLADIFEALIGAIFIDNGFDLDALWLIVYRLIKVEVDYFSEHIPVNVLSWLEKHYTKRYRFENLQTTGERSKSIELKVFEVAGGEGATEPVVVTVIGRGTNKQTCKVAAARRFMHAKRKEALLASQSDTITTTTTTTTDTTTMSRSSTISSSFSAELKSSGNDIDDDEEDEENEIEVEESIKVELVEDYDSEDSD